MPRVQLGCVFFAGCVCFKFIQSLFKELFTINPTDLLVSKLIEVGQSRVPNITDFKNSLKKRLTK